MKIKSFIFILLFLLGCGKVNDSDKMDFEPLENGFGFGRHSKESYPTHSAIWANFEYRGKDTNVAVWPFIDTVAGIQISNQIAVFLGDKSKLFGDGKERLTTRVIAFEAPTGPAMDISDQVLQKWCSQSGIDFTNVMPDSFVELTKTNNGLRLDFGIVKRGLRGPDTIDTADGTAIISWQDVESIMQDVKKNGKLRKENWSGVEYLQKE